MTTLRRLLTERRRYQRGSDEWEYRTRAARKIVWLHRGIPTCEWDDRMKDLST